jgi:hypothetical protein
MKGSIFTPRLADGIRVKMRLNAKDMAKILRGIPWRAEVTDQSTGKSYRVRGAACPIPRCMCDAVIISELPTASLCDFNKGTST